MSNSELSSHRMYDALGAFMAASAVGDLKQVAPVRQTLDKVNFPPRYRWIFAPIKAAAAIGLLSARWFPALARLTTALLTIYFALAVGSHLRVRDLGGSAATAATLMATFAAMTAKGPRRV